MVANDSKPELMRSLGRLVRGLSSLFWGLPVALVLSAQAATSNLVMSLGVLGLVGPGLAHAVLLYGLWMMGSFQSQERIWVASLDRARLFSLLNVGSLSVSALAPARAGGLVLHAVRGGHGGVESLFSVLSEPGAAPVVGHVAG